LGERLIIGAISRSLLGISGILGAGATRGNHNAAPRRTADARARPGLRQAPGGIMLAAQADSDREERE